MRERKRKERKVGSKKKGAIRENFTGKCRAPTHWYVSILKFADKLVLKLSQSLCEREDDGYNKLLLLVT